MAAVPYLIFRMRHGLYAVEARAVREVFLLPELTPLAQGPRCVAGVLNLRGGIVPVMDLGLRLGEGSQRRHLTDAVIVLEGRERPAGILVNEVRDVREIRDEDTEAAPVFSQAGGEASALGGRVAKAEGELITLLEVETLLSLPGEAIQSDESEDGVRPLSEPSSAMEASPEEREVFRARARSLAQVPESQDTRDLTPLAVVALNDEYFGVGLESVREFADLRQVTRIPCCPEHVVGAVNLRGEILTLLDVRGALRMPAAGARAGSKMMVVQVKEIYAGVVVDNVLDIVHLRQADVTAVPHAVRSAGEDHVAGTAPYRGKMLSILDLGGIFAREDWIVNAEAS
jgi:purine-binding chemotaxis protein CheW